MNIPFEFSRDKLQKKIGKPFFSGGGESIPGLGAALNWDIYKFDDYVLNFEYEDGDNAISMISIMTTETSPY